MKNIFSNMLSVIKRMPSAFNATMFALLGMFALPGSAQAVEVDASLYQVFYGDIDGDGNKDIYLAPKPEYMQVPGGNGFKLLAQASGYAAPQLDNAVDTTGLTTGDFQLLAGDFNGDGVEDVLVQSTRQSLLSFTLTNNLVENVPYILQTFASLGSDTHSIVVSDINNDGRDDITYTTNNQSQTLYASNQGHLQSTSQAQVTAHYGYDYLNKRRYKVVEEIGKDRVGVLYIDNNTELRDGKLQKYITLGGQKVARSAQGGGEFSPSEFYLNNHLGSVALTLDDSAQVKNAFTYQPFGGKQIAYGNTELSPYGFTGKEQDPETQLGYFHHRYLNTQAGQFITPDPVFAMNDRFTDPQAWSPYAYARNNPITYIDPDGRVFGTFMGNNRNVGWGVSMQAGSYGNAAVDTGIAAVDGVTTLTGLGGLVKGTGKLIVKGALRKGADDVLEQGAKRFGDEDFYGSVSSAAQGIKSAGITSLEIGSVMKAANAPINKMGVSQAARAWDKHAISNSKRNGGLFKTLKGGVESKNKQAADFIRGVMTNKSTVKESMTRGGTSYRLPNGKGFAHEANGKINFLDPSRNVTYPKSL